MDETNAVVAPPPDMICQVCGTTMEPDAVVYCARCATPHHGDCWDYAGRCATFGCHGTAKTRQPPPPEPDALLVLADGAPDVPTATPGPPGFTEQEGWLEFTARRTLGLRAPRDAFVFQTRLPVEAATAALRGRTEEERLLRLPWSDHRDFEGTVSEQGFDLKRVIDYRNSYVPRLTGRFVPLAKGTGVSVRMDLHLAIRLLAMVWFAVVGLVFLGGVVTVVAGNPSGWVAMGVTAFMLLVGGGVSVGAFWYEVWRARVLLAEILDSAPGARSPGLTATPSRRLDER